MTKSTTVTINGVEYEFSKPNYDSLRFLISKARVVEKAKTTTQATTALKQATRPAPAIIRKQVTNTTLKRALGIHYNEVVIYDCENNKLLTQTYNGERVYWDNDDTKNAKTFKRWFDKEFKKENLTLVCNVSKQVSAIDYPGWGKWTRQDVRMNKKGYYTVCNFIVRDETTGKLKMLNDAAWLGVWLHENPFYAARDGAYSVANDGAWDLDFRRAIVEQCKRSKVAGK